MHLALQNKSDFLVFTDLDGTLLDSDTYEFAQAAQALDYLNEKSIPVIPCTSKTQREVTAICKKMNLNHPFIVENGSAIIIPEQYFRKLETFTEKLDTYFILILGKQYPQILEFLNMMRKEFDIKLIGFNEMQPEYICRLTGLTMEEAKIAKARNYSEPFILKELSELPQTVYAFARKNGFRILKGNRFFHLLGNTDKGHAVEQLQEIYEYNLNRTVTTIGIGDSPNDLAMLQEVDYPVLVRKKDNSFAKNMELASLIKTEGIGPAGWQEAIFKLIK